MYISTRACPEKLDVVFGTNAIRYPIEDTLAEDKDQAGKNC